MKNRYSYKYLILLAAAYFCTFPIISITMLKPIMLFTFQVPSSILVYPITFVLMDIIAEVYGYAIARQIIWCHIILSIYYNFLLFGILDLPSPEHWNLSSAYHQIFNRGLKFTAFFGQLGILIGFFINAFLLSKFKILTKGKYFWMRSVSSSSMGELLQLSIGLLGVALGKLWSIDYVLQLLCVAFMVRLFFIAILSVPATLVAAYLKVAENINPYDVNLNYNPFIFKT